MVFLSGLLIELNWVIEFVLHRRMEPDLGKIFIGGISWDTDEEQLKEYFKKYGEVVEAVIMRDRATGRARGFGFVVFADPAVADRVVKDKHMIDCRTVSISFIFMQLVLELVFYAIWYMILVAESFRLQCSDMIILFQPLCTLSLYIYLSIFESI